MSVRFPAIALGVRVGEGLRKNRGIWEQEDPVELVRIELSHYNLIGSPVFLFSHL
jgi:hypothetical protein